MRSAAMASIPAKGLSRRSRMTTSSWQSMPSTRKTASACSSQTAHVTLVGVGCGLTDVVDMASGLAAGLLYVPQTLTKQREHVLVVERVENHPALAPRPDDANVAQETKLMRDGRLGDAELTGKV